jgi:ABC-type branched-subunit amino acid transport system ATPase component
MLSVNAINVAYGHAKVLHNVSLSLQQGEVVFIAGRNGAGKTTLLKSIAGFLRPTDGSIVFDNADITGLAPEERALSGVRYVFQDKRVFTNLTVKENLELAAYPVKAKMSEVLEQIIALYPKIEQFLGSPAGSLSGGQRQILLISRALIGKPRLLLIDEPTEGLAAGTINDILQVLHQMKGRVSTLIVEQNLSVVGMLADRVYIMQEGKIIREIREKEEIQDRKKIEGYL